MDGKLLKEALVKVSGGILLVGALLFVPAWSLRFWQGWLLMGVLFIPMLAAGFFMLAKCPELLRKRLNAKEEQGEQRQVIALSGLMFLIAFIVAGLNRRFDWLVLPKAVSWAAAAVFLLAYALYAEVLRENAYLSRTIEVQENQTVVDTGLYGHVRHPMYLATLLLFLAMPLILASPLSFAVMLLYIPLIVKRIRNEEQVLEQGLKGYSEYMTRVRWRLVPGIW